MHRGVRCGWEAIVKWLAWLMGQLGGPLNRILLRAPEGSGPALNTKHEMEFNRLQERIECAETLGKVKQFVLCCCVSELF